ncbi:MAG: type II secretion system minor pseudopilin GspK [Pseudomonadota bacterium]
MKKLIAPCRSRPRQGGVAVITALLLTTLAVTIVASLFWQQQVQVRSIENQRMQLQKQWILRGALDWAQLILRGSYLSSGDKVNLQQTWAVGLAETRLDSYVENGRSDSEASDATITGTIIDAQSLLNLTNLATNGVPAPLAILSFKKLLTALSLEPKLADAAVNAVKAGQPPVPLPPVPGGPTLTPTSARLKFTYIEDLLSVPGFTPEIVRKLRGYVIFLPEATVININTASAEVLHAVFTDLPVAQAKTIILDRDKTPFQSFVDMQSRHSVKIDTPDSEGRGSGGRPASPNVTSKYFLLDGKVKLNRAGLDVRALIKRSAESTSSLATTETLWIRENQ